MPKVKVILEHKGTGVITISPDATALDAAHLMNDRGIGALVVVDKGQIKAIVTERDIMRRVVAEERDPATTRVEEIMTSPMICCQLGSDLSECRALMTNKRIRHVPVVEKDQLVGIITIGDALAHEIREHKTTIQHLNDYLYSPQTPHGG